MSRYVYIETVKCKECGEEVDSDRESELFFHSEAKDADCCMVCDAENSKTYGERKEPDRRTYIDGEHLAGWVKNPFGN